jgi:glycosyltransferase involved in cell wall biosynthesis
MKSVIEQTFPYFEYIVIDGSSKDESKEVITGFEKALPEHHSHLSKSFKWISEPDEGIYNAMNKGIRMAKGEYCLFLNSGDYFVSDEVLQRVMQIQPSEDFIYGNLIIHLNGKEAERSIGPSVLTFFDLYVSRLKHQSTFIRTALFHKHGYYNESLKIVADWEFFLKTLGLSTSSYRYIDEDIAVFDNDGISNNLHSIRIQERTTILESILPKMILDDYRTMEKFSLVRSVFNFKLTSFVVRIIAKCAKTYGKIFHKL